MTLPTGSFADWSAPEWSVGGVRFLIDMIPVKDAAPIFRRLVSEMQYIDFNALTTGQDEAADDDVLSAAGWSLIQQLTHIRPEFADWLQDQLFRYVRFQSSSTTPQMLAGAIDMAFADLSVFELHEVMFRSLSRNFLEQFTAWQSRRSGAPAPPMPR